MDGKMKPYRKRLIINATINVKHIDEYFIAINNKHCYKRVALSLTVIKGVHPDNKDKFYYETKLMKKIIKIITKRKKMIFCIIFESWLLIIKNLNNEVTESSTYCSIKFRVSLLNYFMT